MKITLREQAVHLATGGRAHQADAPFVMFLHGSGQSHLTWVLQSRYFAYDGYNVVAPDFPAHGLSEGKPLTSIEEMADWVIELMDALAIKQVHLVGHSQGGLIALEVASRAAERVSKLVLIACAAAIPVNDYLVSSSEHKLDKAIAMMTGWGHGARAHKHENSQPGFSHLGYGRQLMAANEKSALHADLTACNLYQGGMQAAASLTMPVLVLLAGSDKMTPVKFGLKMAEAIPNKRLIVIEKAAHMLPAEHPEEVNTPMLAFLAQ